MHSSHGLTDSLIHLLGATGIDVVGEVRVPGGRESADLKVLSESIARSALIQSKYGVFTPSRHLLETGVGIPLITPEVDAADPHGELIGSFVLRGPDTSSGFRTRSRRGSHPQVSPRRRPGNRRPSHGHRRQSTRDRDDDNANTREQEPLTDCPNAISQTGPASRRSPFGTTGTSSRRSISSVSTRTGIDLAGGLEISLPILVGTILPPAVGLVLCRNIYPQIVLRVLNSSIRGGHILRASLPVSRV